MEETPLETNPQFTAPAPQRKINKRFVYLIAFVILLVLLFAGYKLLGSSNKNNINNPPVETPAPTEELLPIDSPAPTDEITPTPIPSDTPTPKPTSNPIDKTTGLNRSKLSVTVQNGSGEAGVAATGKDFLNGLGYDVISTSNADNFDYTGVTIQVKSASSDYLTLLKSDLGAKYIVGNTSSDLSASVSADALVIIGK